MITGKQEAPCRNCGKPLPAYVGNGRPRTRCHACASDRTAKAAYLRAWHAAHPQAAGRYERNRQRKRKDGQEVW